MGKSTHFGLNSEMNSVFFVITQKVLSDSNNKKSVKLLVHIRKCCIFAIDFYYMGMVCNIIVTIMK